MAKPAAASLESVLISKGEGRGVDPSAAAGEQSLDTARPSDPAIDTGRELMRDSLPAARREPADDGELVGQGVLGRLAAIGSKRQPPRVNLQVRLTDLDARTLREMASTLDINQQTIMEAAIVQVIHEYRRQSSEG